MVSLYFKRTNLKFALFQIFIHILERKEDGRIRLGNSQIMDFFHRYGLRKILVYLLLIAVITIIGYILLQGPATIGDKPDDFVGYWTAGKLIASQKNPYSQENFININRGMGFDVIVLLPVYYPPTVLPILLPFGLISFPISRYLWLILSIIGIFLSGFWIWRLYAGPENKRWIVFLCILTLAPSYFSLIEGQITFLILLGLVGFIYFIDERKWFLAGMLLTILTIKFQLVYLIWVVVLIWMFDQKHWRLFFGLIFSTAFLMTISFIFQPSIISDYFALMINDAPAQCGYVSLSAFFCAISREGTRWLRYLPPVIGTIWVAIYYFKYKEYWIWKDKISLILIVSLMTAPLTWMHDQLLFLIPVIEIVILMIGYGYDRRANWTIAFYLLINIVTFLMIPSSRTAQHYYLWMPVVFLILYLYSKRNFSPLKSKLLENQS